MPTNSTLLYLQSKVYAHIEAINKGKVSYQAGQVMKDWTLANAFSQQSGGMRYRNGQLCVPTAGPYYIYAQLYFHTKGRVEIRKNNKKVTMLQPAEGTGGVFLLRKGDVISLHSNDNVVIYMSSAHTYFGAFLI
ncbi:unnamed protein product [Pocillopora meandrina]|uniref:THD domain-containing protein n=1 Tax=Pocillopora meandrina TaxID=46732 RepID=A0AAU9XG25_9CNID|nr:unnamed protein product [Pocillopora meandrina]